MAQDSSSPSRRYKAFVSYSHRDKAAGSRLFKRLDGWRTPKALRGRPGRHGPAPDRLYPLFRDREELATSRDVRTELDRALEASDHLVVLCSPNAAASEWVNHEIETFLRLGRADRIHCVLADGDPADAFPPALGDAALAADLRPEGDGWTDAPLKLAAGLIGLPFGEVKDREIARARARARINAGIAAVFALLFVAAGLGFWRATSEAQRANAELTRAEAAILVAVQGASDLVDKVVAGADRGDIPVALADTLLTTARHDRRRHRPGAR
jgi:hypothetical protein